MSIPYECCCKHKFDDLASLQVARDLWRWLSLPETVDLMAESCDQGNAAVVPLVAHVRDVLWPRAQAQGVSEERFKGMCLNMSRQVMEHNGYEHVACALIPGGYFTSAGLFRKA